MADRFRTRYLENSDWRTREAGDLGEDPAIGAETDSSLFGANDRPVAPRVYAVPSQAHLEEVREEEGTLSAQDPDDLLVSAGRHALNRKAPFWLTRPCPSWCESEHSEADRPADRRHVSAPQGSVVLTETEAALSADGGWQAQDVHVAITQHVREVEPLITCRGHGPAGAWHLTVAEARALAAALTRAVEATERY